MDLAIIIDKLECLAEYASEEIKQSLEDMENMNDPRQNIRTQFMLNKYSTYTNYESSMVRMIRDLISGIVNKI